MLENAAGGEAVLNVAQASKPSKPSRNIEKWQNTKDGIYQFYIIQDHTLDETIQFMAQKHGLHASKRTWKAKMKTWCFEKNVPATELATVLAKAKKRKREEGKETRIFYNGTEIDEKRIARFKRRELGEVALASPSAVTPPRMIYRTPSPNLAEMDTQPNAGHKDLASADDWRWEVTLLESSISQLSLPTEPRARRQQSVKNELLANIEKNDNFNYGTGEANMTQQTLETAPPQKFAGANLISWKLRLDEINPSCMGITGTTNGTSAIPTIFSWTQMPHPTMRQSVKHHVHYDDRLHLESNFSQSANSSKLPVLEVADLCNIEMPYSINPTWEEDPFHKRRKITISKTENLTSLIIERMRRGTSGADILKDLTSHHSQLLDDPFFQLRFIFTLEECGNECEGNGRIADAISIFELLSLCVETGILLSEEHMMDWTCALARMLRATGEIDRAEKYCRQAAKLYESQPLEMVISPKNVSYELSNQRSLIKLLQACECGIELESLLLRRLCRMIENFWACNAEVIRGVAKSLMQINDTLSKDNRARYKVALELENFTLNLYPRRFVPLDSLPLLHSLVGIASAYSEGRAFKEADLIFELLLLFDSGKMWQRLGSCASRFHFEYGLHFGRQGQGANSKSEWLLSMRDIASGNDITLDVDEEIFVEDLRNLFEWMKTKANIYDKQHIKFTELEKALKRYDAALLLKRTNNAAQNIEADIEGKPAMLHPKLSEYCQQPLNVLLPAATDHDLDSLVEGRGAPKSSHTGSRSVFSWPSSRSCKYGVTYSVSNCTGISDSEFMVP